MFKVMTFISYKIDSYQTKSRFQFLETAT